MLRLLLFRHAKSSWDDHTLIDHDRLLSKRGITAAPRMAQAMVDKGYLPDAIICSTAVRTRQTLKLILPILREHHEPTVQFESSIYEAAPQSLARCIRAIRDEANPLMLVGHNPGMQMLAMLLGDGAESVAQQRLETKFPTAALAVLDFEADSWADIKAGSGRLVDFITPKTLKDQG